MAYRQTYVLLASIAGSDFCVSVFLNSCCKLIILFKNQFVSTEEEKTMAAFLRIIRCQNCSDNSTGRTENWWRET